MVVSWQDATQAQHTLVGLTRDVSSRSAYILTTSPPPLETRITMKAFFPLVAGVDVPVRLLGEGRAVRVEASKQKGAPGGFAVAGKRFVLRRGMEHR